MNLGGRTGCALCNSPENSTFNTDNGSQLDHRQSVKTFVCGQDPSSKGCRRLCVCIQNEMNVLIGRPPLFPKEDHNMHSAGIHRGVLCGKWYKMFGFQLGSNFTIAPRAENM